MSTEGNGSAAGWIPVGIVLALIVWWNIGMPGLQVKSGVYECTDSRGDRYVAALLDREVQGFGRIVGDTVVTVAHKSVRRTSLTSDRVFSMAIEGDESVKCVWTAARP